MPKTRNVKNVRKNRSLKKKNNRNKSMRKNSLRKVGNKNRKTNKRKTNKRRMRGGLSPENSETVRKIHLRRRAQGGPRGRLTSVSHNNRNNETGMNRTHLANMATKHSGFPSSFPAMASGQPAIINIQQLMKTPNFTGEEVNILQQMLNKYKKEWNAKKEAMTTRRFNISNRMAFKESLGPTYPSPAGARNIQRAYNKKRKAEAQAKLHRSAINIKPQLQLGNTL